MQSGREGTKQRVVRHRAKGAALSSLTAVEPAQTGTELLAFLRASPLVGEDLKIERDRTPGQIARLAATGRTFEDLAAEYGEEVAIQVGIARDPDARELTADEIATMRPAHEVMPAGVPRRRGKQKAPLKAPISIKLDADLVARLREGGKGWQTRLNTLLRRVVMGEAD